MDYKINSRYEDKFFVEKYVALWAYGYLNGIGYCEGLYRTINELGFSCLKENGKYNILDIGCGVGRTASSYANFFNNSSIIAIDNSQMMLDYARRIVKTKEKIILSMENLGFAEPFIIN